MPIEKKVASITFKCTDDKADVLRLKAEERGMTFGGIDGYFVPAEQYGEFLKYQRLVRSNQ